MQVVDTFPRPVRVVENVWIPLSDGCQLAARVWLPQDAESRPVPGILEFIPYRKRDHTRLRDEPIHHYSPGTATPRCGWMCVAAGIPTA